VPSPLFLPFSNSIPQSSSRLLVMCHFACSARDADDSVCLTTKGRFGSVRQKLCKKPKAPPISHLRLLLLVFVAIFLAHFVLPFVVCWLPFP
jgi:hypothetical protein